jgi:hypothetical protein
MSRRKSSTTIHRVAQKFSLRRASSRPTPRPAASSTPMHLLDIINLQGYLTTQEAFRQEIALQIRRMGRLRARRPNAEEALFYGVGLGGSHQSKG